MTHHMVDVLVGLPGFGPGSPAGGLASWAVGLEGRPYGLGGILDLGAIGRGQRLGAFSRWGGDLGFGRRGGARVSGLRLPAGDSTSQPSDQGGWGRGSLCYTVGGGSLPQSRPGALEWTAQRRPCEACDLYTVGSRFGGVAGASGSQGGGPGS